MPRLLKTPADGEWRLRALCRDLPDPDVMMPDRSDRAGIATAKALCADCPVKVDCLAWAVNHNERHGIWGGLTTAERDALLGLKAGSAGRQSAGVAA